MSKFSPYDAWYECDLRKWEYRIFNLRRSYDDEIEDSKTVENDVKDKFNLFCMPGQPWEKHTAFNLLPETFMCDVRMFFCF